MFTDLLKTFLVIFYFNYFYSEMKLNEVGKYTVYYLMHHLYNHHIFAFLNVLILLIYKIKDPLLIF
jgi:hypothetical protein